MKTNFQALLLTAIFLGPLTSFAGGYYCAKSTGKGQVTLAFVSTNSVHDDGILIYQEPGQAPLISTDAKRYWSGSMDVTSGSNLTVQGPGNGVSDKKVVIPQTSVSFAPAECREI